MEFEASLYYMRHVFPIQETYNRLCSIHNYLLIYCEASPWQSECHEVHMCRGSGSRVRGQVRGQPQVPLLRGHLTFFFFDIGCLIGPGTNNNLRLTGQLVPETLQSLLP